MSQAAKFHIVIPVFNRREITLNCLRQLQDLVADGEWRICVVDDGSTDGTAAAIAETFPDTTVLAGGGELYWTGAMEMGMRHAMEQGAECCVWMNDDLITSIDAVRQVAGLALMRQAVVSAEGVVQHDNLPAYYYPGFYRGRDHLVGRELDLNSREPIPVDCCRGNLVAIPHSVVEAIGYPDGRNIPHYGGDSDYTLRVTAAGIPCLTLMSALFYEKEVIKDDNRSWLLDDRPPSKIWKSCLSIKGIYQPRAFWTFELRHWGWFGIISFFRAYAKLALICVLKKVVPKPLLLKLYAKRSRSYVAYANLENRRVP